MKFPTPHTLKEISSLLDCEYVGPADFPVLGLNEIHVVTPGDIVFVDHPKYYDKALQSKATVILIDKRVACPEGKALLVSGAPFQDFNKLIRHFKPFSPTSEKISNTAKIGKNTVIQPDVFIGRNVVIGDDCLIHPSVVIGDDTIIGNRVIIQAGTVLGSDAFYYKKSNGAYQKFLSCGNVVLEDDVEIGAKCTIDRGVTGSTLIKRGSKIDNQVQIGHDTIIGENCLLAAQVGIAGCSILENGVTFWGQVGMSSGLTIGENATVLAQSGISKSLKGHQTYFGYPAEESRKKLKEMAALRQLIGGKS